MNNNKPSTASIIADAIEFRNLFNDVTVIKDTSLPPQTICVSPDIFKLLSQHKPD
jgi:hypothetical protein